MWCEAGVQLYSLACGYLFFPGPFVEETIIHALNDLFILVKITIHRHVGLFLSFISWICISIFMPHHFDYCGFLVSFQITGYEYSTTFFFYSIEKHYWVPFISM